MPRLGDLSRQQTICSCAVELVPVCKTQDGVLWMYGETNIVPPWRSKTLGKIEEEKLKNWGYPPKFTKKSVFKMTQNGLKRILNRSLKSFKKNFIIIFASISSNGNGSLQNIRFSIISVESNSSHAVCKAHSGYPAPTLRWGNSWTGERIHHQQVGDTVVKSSKHKLLRAG